MAPRKPRTPDYMGSLADYKESVKPASKKEKLYGQELGKIGRAAERGGPVNTVQQKMGAYSEQVMQNKANRDMPVKRKVQEMGLQLGVAALTNPNTLKGITNRLSGSTIGLHGSPVQGLKTIEPRMSRSDTDTPTVSIMRTDVPPALRGQNVNVTQSYATKEGTQGSIYIVKAKKSATDLPKFPKPDTTPKTTPSGRPVIPLYPSVATKSTAPVKVVAEIPLSKYKNEAALRAEIERQTNLAGSSMRAIMNPNKKPKTTPTKKRF